MKLTILCEMRSFINERRYVAHEDCTCSKYCWFGAVRDTANLHGVHPFNRLMDEHGEITPLFVSSKSMHRSRNADELYRGFQYMYGGHE